MKEKTATVESVVDAVTDASETALKSLVGRDYLEACDNLASHFQAKADAYREETGEDD